MTRKKEEAGGGEPHRTSQRLDDYLIAEEILPKLPAHVAQGFAAASTTLRGILTDPDYWLTTRLPRASPHRPHAACLTFRGSNHEFHYADASFSAETTVVVTGDKYRYAGTCNGLVLLTSPWNNQNLAGGALFNPVTGKEEIIVINLPTSGGGTDGDVYRCFCGLGYSPSTKTYKALVCERKFSPLDCSGKLVVVPLGGGATTAGREEERARTVAKLGNMSCKIEHYLSTLTLDGKVYLLPATDFGETTATALAFDVSDETVTHLPLPYRGWYVSGLMEVWGRPCVATGAGIGVTAILVLSPDHRWERRCTLTRRGSGFSALERLVIRGAWECGDGLLFALYFDGRGFMYDLRKATPVTRVHASGQPEEEAQMRRGTFCWGYQPTLVPPATTFGERGGLRHFSSGRRWLRGSAARRRLDVLMEMMRKRLERGAEDCPT